MLQTCRFGKVSKERTKREETVHCFNQSVTVRSAARPSGVCNVQLFTVYYLASQPRTLSCVQQLNAMTLRLTAAAAEISTQQPQLAAAINKNSSIILTESKHTARRGEPRARNTRRRRTLAAFRCAEARPKVSRAPLDSTRLGEANAELEAVRSKLESREPCARPQTNIRTAHNRLFTVSRREKQRQLATRADDSQF